MPNHILKLITLNLNKIHKSLNGSKILIIGIAYKNEHQNAKLIAHIEKDELDRLVATLSMIQNGY